MCLDSKYADLRTSRKFQILFFKMLEIEKQYLKVVMIFSEKSGKPREIEKTEKRVLLVMRLCGYRYSNGLEMNPDHE